MGLRFPPVWLCQEDSWRQKWAMVLKRIAQTFQDDQWFLQVTPNLFNACNLSANSPGDNMEASVRKSGIFLGLSSPTLRVGTRKIPVSSFWFIFPFTPAPYHHPAFFGLWKQMLWKLLFPSFILLWCCCATAGGQSSSRDRLRTWVSPRRLGPYDVYTCLNWATARR